VFSTAKIGDKAIRDESVAVGKAPALLFLTVSALSASKKGFQPTYYLREQLAFK
jgi:hypothetical protein